MFAPTLNAALMLNAPMESIVIQTSLVNQDVEKTQNALLHVPPVKIMSVQLLNAVLMMIVLNLNQFVEMITPVNLDVEMIHGVLDLTLSVMSFTPTATTVTTLMTLQDNVNQVVYFKERGNKL